MGSDEVPGAAKPKAMSASLASTKINSRHDGSERMRSIFVSRDFCGVSMVLCMNESHYVCAHDLVHSYLVRAFLSMGCLPKRRGFGFKNALFVT
jgi:hypothetical protein